MTAHSTRSQITLDPETQRRAQAKAAELGISFSEYVRRLLARDLGEPRPQADVSVIFNLVKAGEPTDIGRDKHKLIGEAVLDDYLESTGQRPRRRRK